jgi:hypothetical protein
MWILFFGCCRCATIARLKSAIGGSILDAAGPLGREPMIRKCERCGNPMDLFACEPRLGTLPELRTYRCPGCGLVETDAGSVTPLQRGDMQGARLELHDAA